MSCLRSSIEYMSWWGGGDISVIPGIVCLVAAMTLSTLNPMSWPPSPGLAPWATLICSSSALTRYSAVTPNLAEETCLTADLVFLPSGPILNLDGSSPPSPVLLRDPMEFMASARVSWASRPMAPNEMAATSNLFIMDSAGSTSSSGTGVPAFVSSRSRRKNLLPSTREANFS